MTWVGLLQLVDGLKSRNIFPAKEEFCFKTAASTSSEFPAFPTAFRSPAPRTAWCLPYRAFLCTCLARSVAYLYIYGICIPLGSVVLQSLVDNTKPGIVS